MRTKNKVFNTFLTFFKGYKRLSMRWALMFFVIIGIVLPFIIFSVFISGYVNNFIHSMLMDSVEQSVKNNTTQLESIVESLNYTSAFLSTSPYVIGQVSMMNTSSDTANVTNARDNLIKYIRDISNAMLNTANPQITVVTKKGKVIEMEKNYNLDVHFDKLLSDNFTENRIVWDNLLSPGLSTSLKTTWVIRDLDKQSDAVGLLIIELPGNILWSKLANSSSLSSTQMLVKDSQGKAICVSNLSYYHLNKQNYATSNNYNIVKSSPVGNWGLDLVAVTPKNVITRQLNKLKNLILLYLVILFLILLIVLNIISKYISHPVVLLVDYIHKLHLGNFRDKPGEVYFKDMSDISQNLVEVSVYIEELMETAVNQAIAKEKMYFDVLRAQISPHFLYNTLNSIKWMATINGDHIVASMITDLGKILNNVLGKHGETTTLRDELDVLSSYIVLQKMRYGETFVYEADIDDELMDCLIPRFTLQPLVENAIVHGVFSKNNGLITISANKQENWLIITVKDNGSGMDNIDAQKLLKSSSASDHGAGIGIINVHDRIKILFGSKYGLKIFSEVGKGFTVNVLLPYNLDCEQNQFVDSML